MFIYIELLKLYIEFYTSILLLIYYLVLETTFTLYCTLW